MLLTFIICLYFLLKQSLFFFPNMLVIDIHSGDTRGGVDGVFIPGRKIIESVIHINVLLSRRPGIDDLLFYLFIVLKEAFQEIISYLVDTKNFFFCVILTLFPGRQNAYSSASGYSSVTTVSIINLRDQKDGDHCL